MIAALFRFVGRLFHYVWRWLDALRRTLLNLVFLLLIGLVIAMIWRPAPDLPDRAALVLRPSGALVEQARLEEPLDLLRPGGAPLSQTSLRNLLEAIGAARSDDRIQALVIETDGLAQAGLSKLAELRSAIGEFKSTGKPVLARGERFNQAQFFLASVADEVHLAQDGYLIMPGLARYVTYFKNALDTLGVKVHVFRVGEYKSFSEPFTRTDMSDEDRAATRDLLDGVWSVLRDDVAASRRITPEALDRYVMKYGSVLAASSGDAAQAARAAGLIDQFSSRAEWVALLKGRVGENDDGTDYAGVDVSRYLAKIRSERASEPDRVAVLVAQGAIVDGTGTPGSVGGDTLARMIRAAREDERVKALVIRIDSPGGSAWASEVIRRDLEATRSQGKPVVASMSSTAASGGYWIAAGADEIWAHPLSVTGSIGIFALFPDLSEPINRLGLTVDGVATGPLAGAFDPRRPLDPQVAQAMQLGIEHGYRRFLEIVAGARKMEVAEVDLVARGRVWTGRTALELGLVDQLGGLEAAVAAAAARAGLDRYEVVWPESTLSPSQLLMQHLSDWTDVRMPSASVPGSPLASLLAGLQSEAQALLEWNDPRHIYVHCLCAAP